ncbi:zinc metalloproteinase nas-7 [Orussus abietinus]|uniref:zinc metalloproteinase nas-7 n=1 Tax=Orussus abietinus TaxID=222816 RepID=UPI000626557F|nr:zinc metalloproteinase nas-7 [Orussus abietinus]
MAALRFSAFVACLALAMSCDSPPRMVSDLTDEEANENLMDRLTYLGDRIYGVPKNSTGLKVDNWDENSGVNPEELGEYAEGDILFTPQTSLRHGLSDLSKRWPNAVVPYVISPNFSEQDHQRIYDSMDEFHRFTCVRFVPYNGKGRDYVRITNARTGCHSAIGRRSGSQLVNLQPPGCLVPRGTISHELMHTLGFLHEHSRYDRDKYVVIYKQNVIDRLVDNFDLVSGKYTDFFGVGYDYDSVMHYSPISFSKNGYATVLPKGNRYIPIGQRVGLSRKDILRINRMYKCRPNNG